MIESTDESQIRPAGFENCEALLIDDTREHVLLSRHKFLIVSNDRHLMIPEHGNFLTLSRPVSFVAWFGLSAAQK